MGDWARMPQQRKETSEWAGLSARLLHKQDNTWMKFRGFDATLGFFGVDVLPNSTEKRIPVTVL